MQQKHLKNYPVLQKFLESHCQRHHYLFTMKRCRDQDCAVCTISSDDRVPIELLESLHKFPLPVPGDQADHYKSFDEVWGSVPTEKFRPSLGRLLDESQEVVVPFTVSGENCRGFYQV
ncbi:uncharacterized protein LOC134248648 [Saccostrea cucullata]|uniref:uncharacterized protein LOC134248648 n=1 Tax=Saccostrea cuccullata TaxID=36930 RepID=UPI002ED363BC